MRLHRVRAPSVSQYKYVKQGGRGGARETEGKREDRKRQRETDSEVEIDKGKRDRQ